MSDANLREQVDFERADALVVVEVVRQLCEELREPSVITTPDHRLIAVASHVHSLYTGIERALQRVAKSHRIPFERSADWHATLLKSFAKIGGDPQGQRLRFMDAGMLADLNDLRGFRHVFRSRYGLHLSSELVLPAADRAVRVARPFFDGLLAAISD